MTTDEMSPALLAALRELGDTYGPMGVALAAAALASPDDEVEVYRRDDGDYGWRLKAGNHEGIATPGEGYGDKSYAVEAARRSTFREPVDRT
jgi:uncharacterized protein YegP (UPF0339 family)